jgi:hypothetical protein
VVGDDILEQIYMTAAEAPMLARRDQLDHATVLALRGKTSAGRLNVPPHPVRSCSDDFPDHGSTLFNREVISLAVP